MMTPDPADRYLHSICFEVQKTTAMEILLTSDNLRMLWVCFHFPLSSTLNITFTLPL